MNVHPTLISMQNLLLLFVVTEHCTQRKFTLPTHHDVAKYEQRTFFRDHIALVPLRVYGGICKGTSCGGLSSEGACNAVSGCDWDIWLLSCHGPDCTSFTSESSCTNIGCNWDNSIYYCTGAPVQQSANPSCSGGCWCVGAVCHCDDPCRPISTCDHLVGSWEHFTYVVCENPYLPCAMSHICCPYGCTGVQYASKCECPNYVDCLTPVVEQSASDDVDDWPDDSESIDSEEYGDSDDYDDYESGRDIYNYLASSDDDEGLSGGGVAGIVILVLFLVGSPLLIWIFMKKKRQVQNRQVDNNQVPETVKDEESCIQHIRSSEAPKRNRAVQAQIVDDTAPDSPETMLKVVSPDAYATKIDFSQLAAGPVGAPDGKNQNKPVNDVESVKALKIAVVGVANDTDPIAGKTFAATFTKETKNSKTGLSLMQNSGGIYVRQIRDDSIFANTVFRVGMKLISINGVDINNEQQELTLAQVASTLSAAIGEVTMVFTTETEDAYSGTPPPSPALDGQIKMTIDKQDCTRQNQEGSDFSSVKELKIAIVQSDTETSGTI